MEPTFCIFKAAGKQLSLLLENPTFVGFSSVLVTNTPGGMEPNLVAFKPAGRSLSRVAGAGIEPASGGSFTPTVSNRNGLYHGP